VLHVVYIPVTGEAQAVVAPGSGVVGELREDGSLRLDFEGNTYGSPALERYANRVLKAAARQAQGYPTRARVEVAPESALAIGEFDSGEQVIRLTGPDSERLLAEWLGVEAVDPGELIARRDYLAELRERTASCMPAARGVACLARGTRHPHGT
jgi:hypothetical protein